MPRPVLAVFDKRPQPSEGLVPLLGDELKIVLYLLQRFRIQLEEAPAAGADVVDDPGVLEHAKVLGDGLTGQERARR